MTNRDRLNEMSNTELAAFVCGFATRESCDTCPARDLCRKGHNGMVEWLGLEAQTDEKD